MAVLGIRQRRFRPLEPTGLGLCHIQGIGNGAECCQSQEGFGSESGERGLALEGPGILEATVQQRGDRRETASPASRSRQAKTPKGSAIWEWQPYGLSISPTVGLQRQDTKHWPWPSTGPRETDVNRLLL